MRGPDEARLLPVPADTPLDDIPFAVVDTETAARWAGAHMVEVGVVLVQGGTIVHEWGTLINPYTPIQPDVIMIHGITDQDVASAPGLPKVLPALNHRLRGRLLVAHNARFDEGVLSISYARMNLKPPPLPFVDTLKMARTLLSLDSYSLSSLSEYFSLEPERHHRALDDARVTARILLRFLEELKERGTTTLRQLLARYGTAVLGASVEPFEPPDHLPELMLAVYTRTRMEILYRTASGERTMPVKFMTAFGFRGANYVEVWHLKGRKMLTLRSDRILKIRPLP